MDMPYVPVSCGFHDKLLALASLRRECEVAISFPDGRLEQKRGIIVDVYSRRGAEFLEFHDGSTYRLDQIRALNGEPTA